MTAKKCTKKLDGRTELLFCLFSRFFFFLPFSLMSASSLPTSLRVLLIVHLFFLSPHYLSLAALQSWKLMFDWNASKNRQYHEISNCLVCQILIFNKIITCTMEQGRCGGILLCWYCGRLRTQTYFRSSLLCTWWCFLTSIPNPNTKLTLILTLTSTQNIQKLPIFLRLSVVCIFKLLITWDQALFSFRFEN